MDVTPQELRSSEIKDSWRGYDRDEVDDLLERAAVTIESLTQKLQEAASRPAPAAPQAAPAAAAVAVASEVPLPSSREDADMLQRTLLLAQRAADDAVNEAQARARQMLEESEAKAQSLVSDAEATARRIAEGERRRLEAEILDLSARREQLRADADALDAYATGYRERIRAAIESDLENLTGEVEPPAPRPEIHDVDLPAARVAGRDRRPRRRARPRCPRPRKRCTRCSPTSRRGTRARHARARRGRRAVHVGLGVRGRGIRVPVARRRAASTDVGGERAAGR